MMPALLQRKTSTPDRYARKITVLRKVLLTDAGSFFRRVLEKDSRKPKHYADKKRLRLNIQLLGLRHRSLAQHF
jgi:hypothetical protein